MNPFVRKLFPYLVIALSLASLAWAITFGTLPPADFTFNNEDEVKTVDPAKATGQPENRIVNALFEGLLRLMPVPHATPDENGVIPLEPAAGAAHLPEISADGRTYTFKIRENAKWSNGDPVTAHDFLWSWRRTLHPDTASEYSYQLYYIVGAKKYNSAEVEVGDKVEVELADRRDPIQPFPRGTIVRGVLREIRKPEEPKLDAQATKNEKSKANADWQRSWIYVVEAKPEVNGQIDWQAQGTPRAFSKEPSGPPLEKLGAVEQCLHILSNFETEVAASAPDPKTLVVKLNDPTPFFSELTAFYPLYPVHPPTVEKFGSPFWTKPGKIVGNGPFTLEFRRIRDRIRLRKNPHYWDADHVELDVVDALAVKYETTTLNMFLKGQLDWMTKPPNTIIPELKQRPDFVSAPALIVYFYRLNVARKPLDDARIRRALNMAIDKQEICDRVTKAGQRPARSLVPLGLKGYVSPQGGEYNLDEAKRLLAEAGYPGGQGLPKIQILYNTNEGHRDIAEVIQQHWRRIGVDADLRNLEWGVYLDSVHKTDFDVARAGWVPDYSDPNTYLDMFVTGGPQNNTNWGNKEYDDLIAAAGKEPDSEKRLKLFYQAEEILMHEQPIIPIYFYVSINMVSDRVQGFAPNVQDTHPLHVLRIKKRAP